MKATLEIPLKDAKEAESAIAALQSEVDFKGRAKAEVERNKNVIIIHITAEDISSLHATSSSFMRALKVILAV